MRVRCNFLYKKVKLLLLVGALCLTGAAAFFAGLRIFADPLPDDARVSENQELTYYITVNSDGIDHTGAQSSDSQIVEETSGITKVTDIVPKDLIFEGFVTSPDGTFGSVQRDDKLTACAGKVIDDTNEDSVDDGVWNADNTEYTYHGLHYDSNSRTVTFRTKGITAGCELTVGVKTRTPYFGRYEYRKDFYNTASYVDESIAGRSNTVHAYMERPKPTVPGSPTTDKPDDSSYYISYEYQGDVPNDAPDLPAQEWHHSGEEISFIDAPNIECYSFDGWWWTPSGAPAGYKVATDALNGHMPGMNVPVWGVFSKTCSDDEPEIVDPDKYNVSYEVEGTKPNSFSIPASRSYFEGANVEVDSTKSGEIFDGYDFSGWDTDDVDIEEDDLYFSMPSRNVTLRGSFNRDQYTVNYEFIGDNIPSGVALPDSEQHYYGDVVTVAPVVSADGYIFSGWMADPTFEMPAENVTIYGEWFKNKETFTPELSIEITNPKDEFYKGDNVDFKITVKNTQNFELNNVWLEELLDGAYFTVGDGYSVEQNTFAKIANIPAGGEAYVYARYLVDKNYATAYINTVALLSADSGDSNYSLPDEWDNEVSIEFLAGLIPDVPEDEPGEPEDSPSPKTYDGVGKFVISGAIIAGGLGACLFVVKRFRRGGIMFAYSGVIMLVSALGVMLVNGGLEIFADALTERPEFDIYSEKLNFENGDAGAWKIHESASWTGVGEALLNIEVDTNHISNLHKKDVILVLDNGVWTTKAIDGTPVDREDQPTTLDFMKRGASEFVTDLLKNGDSRVKVIATWSDIDGDMASDIDEAIAQIDAVESTSDISYDNYSVSYNKVISYLDRFSQAENSDLHIIYVSDDHYALSNDIATYQILKSKAPQARISSIGLGSRELMGERYVSSSSANESGIVRFWEGVDGNMHEIGWYNLAVLGLDKISNYHENPYVSDYAAALTRCVDTSTVYDKFDVSTSINFDDFDIKGIYGDVGDISVDGNTISWKNDDDNGLVSGKKYKIGILLRAKDESVEKHKLYRLNTNTTVESDDEDVEAESVSSNTSVVLMNGYELKFDINNSGTCSLGNNQETVYLAHQKIDFDLSGVNCDGWNFDTFKDSETGLVFSNKNNEMPAKDTELAATWRKTDVEIHMDGTIYVAAPAVLKPGIDFNNTLYSTRNGLANNKSNIILKAEDGCPSEIMDDAHRLSADDSVSRVYAWVDTSVSNYEFVDPDTGEGTFSYSMPLYYCSDADKIKLNEDSSRLFFYGYYQPGDSSSESYDIRNQVKYVEGIEDWDASDVKKLDYAFGSNRSLGALTYEAINNWDTSNVESMDGILSGGAGEYNHSPDNNNLLSGWDTSNVKSMKYAFSGTSDVFSKFGGVSSWDVSSVEDMTGILEYTYEGLDLSRIANWNVSNVKVLDEAFYGVLSNDYYPVDLTPLATWGPKLSNLESLNLTFAENRSCESGCDFSAISNWNVSNVKTMEKTFYKSRIKDLSALDDWDVSNVENMKGIFEYSGINTNNDGLGTLAGIDGWVVSSVKDLSNAFHRSNVVDLSALATWDTSSVENMSGIFSELELTNLQGLEEWAVGNVVTLNDVFADDTSLTNLDAISGWEFENLESLDNTFRGISANDVTALKKWNVSTVKSMSGIFCGAYDPNTKTSCMATYPKKNSVTKERGSYGGVKSLVGIEGWDTSNVENMSGLVAGSVITDLTPLAGWNVKKVKDLSYAFMHLNITSLEPLSGWETNSLGSGSSIYTDGNLAYTFAFDKNLVNLHGLEGWDISNVSALYYTFAYMDKLESISALEDWNVSNVTDMFYTFVDHKKLTSLDGLQDWDVSKLKAIFGAFMGYSPYSWDSYTDWANYGDSSLTDISALSSWGSKISDIYVIDAALACNKSLSDLTPLSSWKINANKAGYRINRFLEGDRSVTSLNGLQNLLSDVKAGTIQLDYAFMNMSGLTDVSALSSWSDNSNVKNVYLNSTFRNDSRITSLAPLEDTLLKKVNFTAKSNTFDNIPTSVARPSWH